MPLRGPSPWPGPWSNGFGTTWGSSRTAPDIEELAETVEDNGGMFIVPAFSGLFAPYWRDDARGVMVGLTRYIHKGHMARAVLEACAYQTRDILEAMNKDAGHELPHLKVDGGMVENNLLMQIQADVLNVPVIRPRVAETTALGAAYAAGLAVGFWSSQEELRQNWAEDRSWQPACNEAEREAGYSNWKRAVERTFNWVQ
jgi:glycerol kinase